MSKPQYTESKTLLDQLERSFRGGAWHGPALTEVLHDVDPSLARQSPPGGGHTIFEMVSHIAFSMTSACARIAGEPEDNPDDDWKPQDDGSPDAWIAALAALEQSYRQLHASVSELNGDALDQPVSHADPTVRGLLMGILQHNAYHAGQIMQIVKLMRNRS